MAVLGLTGLLLTASVQAKSPADNSGDQVDMFSAIQDGQIDVKLIPKDSTQARVVISNKTDQPLTIKLPDAFAAMPVLAQAPAAAKPAAQPQQGGGGMGGMGGMGGGMFNVPPEKVGQFNVPLVCLEHGKREPSPRIPYEIRPLDSATQNPEVAEVCRMLGTGQLNQRAAQAATWHLNNGMSWEELSAKQYHYADGHTSPYFSAAEIQAAMQISAVAARTVAEHRSQPASASTGSSSTSTGQTPTGQN
jgi:hypothetical protein